MNEVKDFNFATKSYFLMPLSVQTDVEYLLTFQNMTAFDLLTLITV